MFINLFVPDFLLESDKNATSVIPVIHSFLLKTGATLPLSSLWRYYLPKNVRDTSGCLSLMGLDALFSPVGIILTVSMPQSCVKIREGGRTLGTAETVP